MKSAEENSRVANPKTTPEPPFEDAGRLAFIRRFSCIVNWPAFKLLLLVWTPAAMAGIYTKWAILRWDGYNKTAISLGRPVLTAAVDNTSLFTAGEKLSFFRADLMLSVVLVPIALLLLSRLRRQVFVVWALSLIGIAWIVAMTIQLEAYRMIGSFQSWDLLKDALRWGFENARQAKTYILGMAIFRALALGAMVLLAALLGSLRNNRFSARIQRIRGVGLAWALSLGVAGAAWLPWMPRTACHFGAQWATLAALPDSTVASSLNSLSRAELGQRYRQLTQSPARLGAPEHWADAQDYDVLFFVLETTPERCVAFDGSIDDLPNLRKLRAQAWVGAHHYSPYPVTSRALFSLLTSLYPPDNSKDTALFRAQVNGGMIRNLTAAGYQTAVYGSSASIRPWADSIFNNLGFAQIRAADGGQGSSSWAGLGFTDPVDPDSDKSYVTHQQVLDLLALGQLKTDLDSWIRANRRFAAVYLPQISHAPWGDIRSNGRETSLLARCRALVEVQDGWLGDILSLLETRGRLSRTLIVVTGDHGIRTSVEDPTLSTGAADDYTFQVPFMLYAPGILHSTSTLPWVTSHIDVAPAILDLLGISRNTDEEQGIAIWDERIARRTTYFLASLFLGVDGYYSQSKFYSWNRTLNTSYQGDRLHFGLKDVVPSGSALHGKIAENLQSLDELRSAWFRASPK